MDNGHVARMSQERTAKKLLGSTPGGRRSRGRRGTQWQNYVEDLSWSRLDISIQHSVLCRTGSRCLETPTGEVDPATSYRQVGLEKCSAVQSVCFELDLSSFVRGV